MARYDANFGVLSEANYNNQILYENVKIFMFFECYKTINSDGNLYSMSHADSCFALSNWVGTLCFFFFVGQIRFVIEEAWHVGNNCLTVHKVD